MCPLSFSLSQANIRAQQQTMFHQITEKKASVKKVEHEKGTWGIQRWRNESGCGYSWQETAGVE